MNPYESMFKDVSDIPKTDVFARSKIGWGGRGAEMEMMGVFVEN